MTKKELQREFLYAKKMGWLPFFKEEPYGVPAHILMGIASRETNMKNIMGDRGHGHGLMQIDDRSFPDWTKSNKWKSPHESIKMGAFVLRSKYNMADKVPEINRMRVAIAMYNAGRHALTDWIIHADPDLRTTGRNYSRDVLSRAEGFKALLGDIDAKTVTAAVGSPVASDGLWDRVCRTLASWLG